VPIIGKERTLPDWQSMEKFRKQ